MICPMKFNGILAHCSLKKVKDIKRPWADCEKEKCAWWVKKYGCCSVKALLRSSLLGREKE